MRSIRVFLTILSILSLSACGGGGGGGQPLQPPGSPIPPPPPTANPDYHLRTDRFTTHQPKVLEQVGAHHAYARGLTGRGVRIGIDDSIVDFTQSEEFGSRVKLGAADGANLAYSRPLGARTPDIGACQIVSTCRIVRRNSQGDSDVVNDWVQEIVNTDGWPVRDDSVFIVDEHYSESDALESISRWKEVPTPYEGNGPYRFHGPHGTVVASVAAGKNIGVAPGATIIPIAHNLTEDQNEAIFDLQSFVAALSVEDRMTLDSELASLERDAYKKFDIINRSYGRPIFDSGFITSEIEAERQWFSRNLPLWWDATFQVDRNDRDKTILVYAAGNESQSWSGIGADLPYYIPELRGHSLAVAATDPDTGEIADYSNRCGPLPSNWNSARHGPHYCLSAPGTVRGLVPNSNTPGRGDIRDGLIGTSFATPVVSGALALLMEHFRGIRGNTEIVRRMLETANRTGRYANLEIYGAGLLDLEAALSPVGVLTAGQTAQALGGTALQLPTAFGSMTDRLTGLELTAFDEQDFPFWIPVTTLVSTRESGRSPIPGFKEKSGGISATTPDVYGLPWMPTENAGSLWLDDGNGWITGFNSSSVSLVRSPHDGGWGYGFSFENSAYMGAGTSGAFGSGVHSSMVWSSRTFQHAFAGGWRLDAVGTLALSMPQYDRDAIFRASPSILSAISMRLGSEGTGLVIEQPLRAESGTGIFRIENGRIENGRRLYEEYRVPLQPDRRETRVTIRHDREALGGELAFQVSSAVNAGHVSGNRDSSLGMAYRMSW